MAANRPTQPFLCLKKKKKPAITNRFGFSSAPQPNNQIKQKIQQLRKEKEEKARKERIARMGWQTVKSGEHAIKSAFEPAPASSEEEEVDEEEIPLDARMRMKNLGRQTKTSAGPNSYGKSSKAGFKDPKASLKQQQKVYEEQFYSEDRADIEAVQSDTRVKKQIQREAYIKEQKIRQMAGASSITPHSPRSEIARKRALEHDGSAAAVDGIQVPRRKSRFDSAMEKSTFVQGVVDYSKHVPKNYQKPGQKISAYEESAQQISYGHGSGQERLQAAAGYSGYQNLDKYNDTAQSKGRRGRWGDIGIGSGTLHGGKDPTLDEQYCKRYAVRDNGIFSESRQYGSALPQPPPSRPNYASFSDIPAPPSSMPTNQAPPPPPPHNIQKQHSANTSDSGYGYSDHQPRSRQPGAAFPDLRNYQFGQTE